MKLDSCDGARYTEHNGMGYMEVSHIFINEAIFSSITITFDKLNSSSVTDRQINRIFAPCIQDGPRGTTRDKR